MNKLIVILGPTGTGKTALALKLCRKFNGEIISADSRQIYREMDIGTGKRLRANGKWQMVNRLAMEEQKDFRVGCFEDDGINIWLYDIVNPNQRFNASDYAACSAVVKQDILVRDKIPFFVGGTGFYLDAALGRLNFTDNPPNWRLRRELTKLTTVELSEKLKVVNPKRYEQLNESDIKNPRRLIRSLEISLNPLKVASVPPDPCVASFKSQEEENKIIYIGLKTENKNLYQLIDDRVEVMFKNGLEDEVNRLVLKYGWDAPGLASIGYVEFKPYFENRQTSETVKQKIKFNSHAYARRQLTYFKRQSEIKWFDICRPGFDRGVERQVELHLG